MAIGARDTIKWISARKWRRKRYGWVIPFLAIVAVQADAAYAKALSQIPRIIQAADKAQNTLINELPLIAEELVNKDIKSSFSPPVRSFFMSPVHTLPVIPETMSKMCDRMRPFADSINKTGFKTVPESRMRRKAEGKARDQFDNFCTTFGRPAMVPNDVLPGEEGYQIRVFAGGDELSTVGERGVQVATWGGGGDDEITKIRDELTQISFAQSEYYFSGRTTKEEALWTMNWRARLRGFRWPGGSLSSDCARQGGPSRACSALPKYFNSMKWATNH